MTATQNTIVVAIEHEYSSSIYVVENQEQADDLLYRYVSHWWESTMGDESKPRKKKDAVDLYFEGAQDESCTMEEAETTARAGEEVWGLVIWHEYGSDGSIHATEDAARDHLHGFVKEWWGTEVNSDVAGSIPADRDEAIDAYFEIVDESYALDKAVLGAIKVD